MGSIKKEDAKKIVDLLKELHILTAEYTGKITLHITQGTTAGIQFDHMIKPK